MSENNTAICTVCGKKYKTCLSCRNLDIIKPWRNITDTVECYKVFLAVSQYNNGYLSKEEAKKQLEAVSFNREELRESVQTKVTEITSSLEAPKKMLSKSSSEKNVNSN